MNNHDTIIVRNDEVFQYHVLTANPTDDVIKVMGGGVTVNNITITDKTGSRLSHRDAIQLIPRGSFPNAQYHGAIMSGTTISNNTIRSNGALQGIFASDGLFVDLEITGNEITTNSTHEITICGMLSGKVDNNDAEVVLKPLRIGGGLPNAFYVKSFIDREYEEISGDHMAIDERTAYGVVQFDHEEWYAIASSTPYTTMRQHFTDVFNAYFGVEDVDTYHTVTPSLADVISSHEGGYGSYNRGRAGDAGNKKLPKGITISEILKRGELPQGHKKRLWATGRYQLIPPTLKLAVKSGVVSRGDVYSPKVQDRIFSDYLLRKKRSRVYKYIVGEYDDKYQVLLSLSKEWASLPSPKDGRSYYANRNNSDKAHTPMSQIVSALDRAREVYQEARKTMPLKQAYREAVFNSVRMR